MMGERYPMNAALAAYDGCYKSDGTLMLCEQGVSQAIATLGEREQCVLRQRYQDGMTFNAIGKAMELTGERVRQIELKALRKLRHPSKMDMASAVPMTEHRRLEAALAEKDRHIAWLQKTIDALTTQVEPVAVRTGMSVADLAVPIDDMALSVRAYNCLERGGIKTAGDICKLDDTGMRSIRNLGSKCIAEIDKALGNLGLSRVEG